MESTIKEVIKEHGKYILRIYKKGYHIVILVFISIMATGFISCSSDGADIKEEQEKQEEPDPDKGEEIDDTTFQIAVLPDTQYYSSLTHPGGTLYMFEQQIDWILKNYESSDIKYVVHLGDMVDHGGKIEEWERAIEMMYKLESPLPGLPDGIPYGVGVGNHDQQPNGNPNAGGTDNYNKYFGVDHFEGYEYYGGSYGDNNDNHYDLFTANGEEFIVIYLEYNYPDSKNYNYELQVEVLNWAKDILERYSDRKAIIVSHSILNRPAGSESDDISGKGDNSIESGFTKQGKQIYEALKNSPNVFLMLCGHIGGEGHRVDTFNGNTITSLLSDYQFRDDASGSPTGGNGFMRTMEFNQTQQTLNIRTFIPQGGAKKYMEMDGDSNFSVPLYD